MDRRRRVTNFGVILLAQHLLNEAMGISGIPPVTLFLTLFQLAVFLRYLPLPWSDIFDVCISSSNAFEAGGLKRIILSAFEHGDDMHLYYNMVSFIMKGRSLERRFGPFKFTYLLIVFTILTNLTLVVLGQLAGEFLDLSYRTQCAVGFSGVIFALKVLCTHYWPSTQSNYIAGVRVPYASLMVWAELILIQLMVPNASFLGHLAGILVGLSYTVGPLKGITDFFWNNTIYLAGLFKSQPHQDSFNNNYYGNGANNNQYQRYVPPDMTEEEQIQAALQASMQDNYRAHHQPPPPGFRFAQNEFY